MILGFVQLFCIWFFRQTKPHLKFFVSIEVFESYALKMICFYTIGTSESILLPPISKNIAQYNRKLQLVEIYNCHLDRLLTREIFLVIFTYYIYLFLLIYSFYLFLLTIFILSYLILAVPF